MLNKLIVALCALGLSFAVACGGGDTTPDETHAESAVEETAPAEEAEHADHSEHGHDDAEHAEAQEEVADDEQELAGDDDYEGDSVSE